MEQSAELPLLVYYYIYEVWDIMYHVLSNLYVRMCVAHSEVWAVACLCLRVRRAACRWAVALWLSLSLMPVPDTFE